MQLSLLNDLCLICSNYNCEQESYHQKYSLNQIQKLLSCYFHLQVSQTSKNTKKNQSNVLQDRSQINQKILKENSQKHIKKLDKRQNQFPAFLRKFVECLEDIRQKQDKNMIQLEQVLEACLSSIYFLLTFDSDPLLFHDVIYIIKMIVFHKYRNQVQIQECQSLPFTQKRIKRTIKKLEKRILNNTYLNKKQCDLQNSLNFNKQRPPFKDLTQKFYPYNQVQRLSKIQQKITNQQITGIQKIVFDDVSLCSLAYQLNILILENKITDRKLQTYFINRLINQIENLQIYFTSEHLSSPKNHKKNKNSSQSISNHKKIHQKHENFQFQEEADFTQFTFIQGVPFPKNRRSVDFSILQLTDEIFLSYLPSLQKLKDLEQLCIRKNQLTKISYMMLKNTFPKLRSLDIRQNQITPQICQLLTEFSFLNIFYISECQIQSKSLIQICLKLKNLNVLYCDNLVLLSENNDQIEITSQDSEIRSIFYIMALNLKRLMYLSIKGYFPSKIIDQLFRHDQYQHSICLSELNQTKELKIFKNIYNTLQKRHGLVQI